MQRPIPVPSILSLLSAVLLFDEIARQAAEKGITWADLSLTSDSNRMRPSFAGTSAPRLPPAFLPNAMKGLERYVNDLKVRSKMAAKVLGLFDEK